MCGTCFLTMSLSGSRFYFCDIQASVPFMIHGLFKLKRLIWIWKCMEEGLCSVSACLRDYYKKNYWQWWRGTYGAWVLGLGVGWGFVSLPDMFYSNRIPWESACVGLYACIMFWIYEYCLYVCHSRSCILCVQLCARCECASVFCMWGPCCIIDTVQHSS